MRVVINGRGDYVNAVLKALEDPVTGKAPENLKVSFFMICFKAPS